MNAALFGSSGFDPSTLTLGQLAAIRGAMWPQCGSVSLSLGPRPGQPSNIAATDFLEDYSPTEQAAVIGIVKSPKYTHVVVGPIVDSDGYHGIWTPRDWRTNFSAFLDELQRYYNNGLIPIIFIHPDGWTYEQTVELTPLFTSPRAQKLMRIVVPTGWEPTRYDWSSYTWALFCQWARQTWPNALVLIHTVADVDAPAGVDERGNDNMNPNGNGDAWSRVAPYIHGWLIQNGAYTTGPAANPTLAHNFAMQFDPVGGAETHGPAWHFANGVSGWPTGSAWGPTQRIYLYNAECTAYTAFWQNPNPISEADRCAWGDLAMANGAFGYLDGGTVAVPVRN